MRSGLVAAAAAVLAAASLGAAARRPAPPAPAQCPAPRVSQWSGIRDTLWPLIAHRDGDDRWAHLDPARLPGQSATWCNPLAADAAALAAGRDLYAASCATCHGDGGRGDGPGAGQADPPPYDFTRPEFAGMSVPPGPAVLYAIVARGIEGTSMAGYPDLSGWERLAIIAWLQRLPGPAALGRSAAWADSLRARRP